jgi:hypothetical protein
MRSKNLTFLTKCIKMRPNINMFMSHQRFSWRWLWRALSSCILTWKFTGISPETSVNFHQLLSITFQKIIFLNETSSLKIFFRNISYRKRDDAVPQATKRYKIVPPRKHQISHEILYLGFSQRWHEEYDRVLRFNAVRFGESPTFRRNMSPNKKRGNKLLRNVGLSSNYIALSIK